MKFFVETVFPRIRKFPVLIQGETSVGKTSLIKYLAALTGNVCIRINNHEHTDLQEYLGSYLSDAEGKLSFVEGKAGGGGVGFASRVRFLRGLFRSLFLGPLVRAMRKGHWVILDELNLAPPDILEALNRVRGMRNDAVK